MDFNLLNNIIEILQNILTFVSEAFASIPEVIETLENATSSASEALSYMPSEIVAPAMAVLYFMINLAALRWIT